LTPFKKFLRNPTIGNGSSFSNLSMPDAAKVVPHPLGPRAGKPNHRPLFLQDLSGFVL
jgi:hypothetical protein